MEKVCKKSHRPTAGSRRRVEGARSSAPSLITAVVLLLLILLMPAGGGAANWYWIGDPGQAGSGDWNASSPNLWNPAQDGSGTAGIPASGDTANILQSSSSAGLLAITYSGGNYSSSPLGTIMIKNTAATGSSSDTGVGWVMLDQTGGAMNTNFVKIGPLGVYTLQAGTLTVQSSLASGVWTTGTLGVGGYITKMSSGRPYEGGVFSQSGGAVQTPAVSLGWSGVRNATADGLYVLLNGALKVSDDTGGGVIASESQPPGTMYVGTGGNGTVFQGSGPNIPTSGAITQTTVGWTYAGPGGGGTVETTTLYLGSTHSDGSTTFYGNGYYNLLYGSLTVHGSAYIGQGGNATNASSGDFTQGYSNDAPGQSVVGDGASHVTVGGDLLFGQSGGSGSYELYNGTLTVNGSGATHPGGTNGGLYIGFGGSQGSSFTQGKPYQDGSGNWTTSSAYYDAQSSAWIPLKGGGPTNSVTASNLYIGMAATPNDSAGPEYTLSDGVLTVGSQSSPGNTYVGYNGVQPGNPSPITGIFTQGQAWVGSTALVTPGGTFNNTGNLYVGYNQGGGGVYSLANGTLNVGGSTYVGYGGSNGYGSFTQGQTWAPTPVVSPGGTFNNTGNLYVGYTSYDNGTYTLANGTLNVGGSTYVGYSSNGWGTFVQGQVANGSTTVATPGGTFTTTGNMYIGYNSGSFGSYTLANGTLHVNGATYVGYNGFGAFNQSGGVHAAGSIIVGGNGTYDYSGGTVTGALQNNGRVNVTGGTVSAPNTFAAPVTNNAAFDINQANVIFANAVTNDPGGIFTINGSNVTFKGDVVNFGAWITDPSTIIFNGNFTTLNGSLSASNTDTFEFLGAGTHIIDLGGNTLTIASLVLGSGVILDFTGTGSLTVASLIDSAASASNITGNTADLNATFSTFNAVPIPGAIWLLGTGLAGLISLRRRTRKK